MAPVRKTEEDYKLYRKKIVRMGVKTHCFVRNNLGELGIDLTRLHTMAAFH